MDDMEPWFLKHGFPCSHYLMGEGGKMEFGNSENKKSFQSFQGDMDKDGNGILLFW
jgi:hypothetical protein